MNRIILIGNGFDLAHGLKTSYQDFLDDYWQKWYKRLCDCKDCQLSDDLYHFEIKRGDKLANMEIGELFYRLIMHIMSTRTWEQIISDEHIEINSFEDLAELCDLLNEYQKMEDYPYKIYHQAISPLFKEVNNAYLANWVDIENEYYRLLKSHINTDNRNESVKKLNSEFSQLKELLEKYLTEVCKEDVELHESIKNALTQPIRNNEIGNSKKETLIREINAPMLLRANFPELEVKKMVKESATYLNNVKPQRTLFLNFNYTNTVEKLYAQSQDTIINIHGELNSKKNPIVFGYGDELDSDYKTIINLNDNDCLENIKSINYLQTYNYHKLLDFISTDHYQIYIMGHSCGNSDRTLLNTLFEHKNCVSVKPYYHKKEDGTDNYIEIVQNIYRNFTDMALMRDIVVNKDYCEPMCLSQTE